MSRSLKSFVVVTLFWLGTLFSTPCQAEWIPGKYMAEALTEMLSTVRTVNDKIPWGYDDAGVCLSGVLLSKGATYSLGREFVEGKQYAILAGGDSDARDIDLQILTESGQVVAQDRDAKRGAVVVFTPDDTAKFVVRIKLYDSRADAKCFCTFAVIREGGVNVPVANVVKAAGGFMQMCERTQQLADNAGLKASFISLPNQAAVWGCVLNGGESTTVTNVNLGSNLVAVLAAGDTQANDLDLEIVDTDGTEVGSDLAADDRPVVTFAANSKQRYNLELKNATQDGNRALTMFGVVRLSQ